MFINSLFIFKEIKMCKFLGEKKTLFHNNDSNNWFRHESSVDDKTNGFMFNEKIWHSIQAAHHKH